MKIHYAFLICLLLASSCVTTEPELPSISLTEATVFVPAGVKDREGWAKDIIAAIEKIDKPATVERVCATIAIIGQESGFQTDPIVNDLPKIVRSELEKKFSPLGPLAGAGVAAILQAHAPGSKETFEKRIAKLKTESDLDRFFRDVTTSVRDRFPGSVILASTVSKLMGHGWLEDLNPVTTAGPMQVKVAFAKDLDDLDSLSDHEVRDLLYTRKVGIRVGVARLLDYRVSYSDVLYRFADYNSGVYSSRNAAFQKMLSDVTGRKLAADGDILAYKSNGGVSSEESNTLKAMLVFGQLHDISAGSVRRAAKQEKTVDFEDTDIYLKVREIWQEKKKNDPYYAQIPDVALTSAKLASTRSTGWFAKSVKKRYDACRSKADAKSVEN